MTKNTTEARGNVILEMSVSLDGFIAGPNVGVEHPMGEGGERLHDWMFDGKSEGEVEAFQAQKFRPTGAVVMGRRTFDLGVGPWGDNPAFHAPCFVLSNHAHEAIAKEGGTTYTFVTGGVDSAVAQARAAAGNKVVTVLGGANTAQQLLRAGLLDEVRINLVPVLLGDGVRLFDRIGTTHVELDRTEVSESPGVTHLRFRVVK